MLMTVLPVMALTKLSCKYRVASRRVARKMKFALATGDSAVLLVNGGVIDVIVWPALRMALQMPVPTVPDQRTTCLTLCFLSS